MTAAHANTPPERSRDLDRLLTFIDAIVAIAITLLVLPLAEIAGEVGEDDSVWRTVREHAGQFGAFVLSFVVIARIWLAQHRVVRDATDSDGWLAASLVAWTLTIVFLPFPTALLANAGDQAATKVFYIGTLAVSSALLGLVSFVVRRQLPASTPNRPTGIPGAIDATVFVFALVISVAVPVLGYYPLLLLVLAGRIEARLLHRQRRGSA